MSDTSIKQFFYLAAKNLFGLKISREEFEQSKHEDFDLSENLKCMFDKQNGRIINIEDSNSVSGKNQFIERENFNKKLDSNVFAYNYVTHFPPANQAVNPKSQISDSMASTASTASTTSDSNSDDKRFINDLEDRAQTILKSTKTTDTISEAPTVPVQTSLVQTRQQQQITPSNPEEKEDSQNSDVESQEFTVEDNSPLETKSAVKYYKSLVNNIFPGYFNMDSESLGYNMEGGENETIESQKAPINWEAKAYQSTQPQPSIAPATKQDNINLDDKLTGNFTSENSPKEDSILDPKSAKRYYKSLVNNIYPGYFNMNSDSSESIMKGGENESNQINIEKPLEINKAPEKEFEDKIITTEEKKQQENIIIVNPDEIKEKPKDNINVIPSFNETQKQEKQEIKTSIPSFLESNIMKGGELPPDSSISQNTQNIILNAFNELTDKKKNNLF